MMMMDVPLASPGSLSQQFGNLELSTENHSAKEAGAETKEGR